MADITNLFKATLKTVKARQKAQGKAVGPDKSILGNTKRGSIFAVRSKEVANNISQLRDFLLEHRKDYINASGISERKSRMTDAERDQIDSEAEKFMKTCADAIKLLKTEANADTINIQAREHREEVFRLLDFYLKAVCQIYSTQRAIRVKRVVDKKRISRLQPEARTPTVDTFVSRLEGKEDRKEENNEITDSEKLKKESQPPPDLFGADSDDEEITQEEAQLFEEENQQLYEEMNSMVDEIKHIEGKVVEIAKLQEIFADKVLEQDTDIDRIADTVVGTTENIKEANEEIREAMKNNAGLRVWILFFLIVCTFSLLFLDWYNP